MGSLKHGGDRNKVQDQPNGDRNRAQDQPNVDKNQFQFPIFWLPYKHEEDETRGDKEAKADHESAERSSPNLKVASAQLPSSKVGLKATENNVNGKTNHVKQQEELHNTGKTKEGEGKARGITMKEIEHSGDKKPSDDGTKRQSPSPQKTSKLPPVCLRVDPLPKRKNSHGDSRSPSPSHKEKAQEAFGDRSESTSSIKESEEVEPNKGKIKVVKVVDGITKQDTGEDCKAQTPIGAPVNLFPKSGEDVSTNQDTSKVVVCDDVREDKEVKAPDATVESHLGLHPTVRNFRKSVAKELVSLQEKLDSLPTNKSEVSNVKLVEDLSMNAKGDSSFEETGNGNSFAETQSNHSNISDLVEPSQCQISNITEATSGSQIMENSEMKLVKKEACEESEDKIIASPLQSSRELVDKLKDDLNNEVIDDGEMMMLKAQTDGSELKLLVEPIPSAAEENVDSAVVGTMPSCLGDQSAASPEFNQELVIEQSPRHELIEIGNCEVLQGKGEVESQSAIGITTSIAEANQVQQTLDALNDASVIVDLKHEIGEESDFEGHEDVMAEQEEAQKEVGHINENVKISRADDEIGLGNAPIEDARLNIEEFTVQKHGEEKNNTNELLDTSEPEKPQPQLAFAEDEIHDGEACKPEEPHAEFSPLENETHCGVASKTEETWPGLSPALGQENDDSGITNDEDNCSRQDIKETKECNEESENQEIVGDRLEFKELVSVAGNDKVTEQLCGSETSKEALIATQFVPADAEELPQVEGELFPMSPNYSQVSLGSKMGSESDEKLVEENKKLREIMEKLIETGTEQLTAISDLSSKVKDLEKKLARKKKSRTRRSELELPVLNMQMML
ncbi:BAG family molecular chaperone regulator 6-like [Camellia sinensis]|uniref:BAG family molecular chaperone regulator 6-like n=1 Tax=Camellia sinensis TaxID=4442 RepID=UPI001036B346|nr:BAG family molecular chaperone regulator 6-like [Camellia sinensis]